MRARIRQVISADGVGYCIQIKEFWFMPWRYYTRLIEYGCSAKVRVSSVEKALELLQERFGNELIIEKYFG